MMRTERLLHWRLWLLIAPVLTALFILALMHRPAALGSSKPPLAAPEVQP